MSSQAQEPSVPADETGQAQEAVDPESTIGNLTVEDDPEGTVDPSELAGTASEDDEDVS
ncbi:hypothetical protein SAMN04488544_3750 [Microlunatus sagamiharensis]|uniref:Uncharacterized protein n=1 Tax=Microlunatus sagamiharensis TaxID=546874 RepID=A0A1H2NCE6_9ACTN|nr:hypothetical protein [Microlunatus sagamiharensis]SDV03137.1 hypothetical protein SAMN04488544_3750 [Microlunatus sagamiharensis]